MALVPRHRRRRIGDDLSTLDPDVDTLSDVSAQVTAQEQSILSQTPYPSSPANPASGTPATGGGSALWGDVGSFVSSFAKGFITSPKPTAVKVPTAASSSSSTLLWVGGGIAILGIGYLLLRRR